MRGKWILFGGIVVLAGAGLGAWSLWRREITPPPVQQAPPELPSGAEVRLDGVLRASNVVVVKAPIDGVLEDFPVQPGDEVFEGQLLGRVSNETLRQNEREAISDLERAQARVNALESALIAARLEESRISAEAARARSDEQRTGRVYQRQQLLWREGATPRKTFEAAEKEYQTTSVEAETLSALSRQVQERVEQAAREVENARRALAEEERELEEARNQLAAAELHSPVDGVVLAIRKSAGEEVRKEDDVVIEIGVDLSALEAVLEPPPDILKRIAPGQPALVQIAELPGDGLPATVSKVEEERVIVEFVSPSPLIRPGITVLVRLKLT